MLCWPCTASRDQEADRIRCVEWKPQSLIKGGVTLSLQINRRSQSAMQLVSSGNKDSWPVLLLLTQEYINYGAFLI